MYNDKEKVLKINYVLFKVNKGLIKSGDYIQLRRIEVIILLLCNDFRNY